MTPPLVLFATLNNAVGFANTAIEVPQRSNPAPLTSCFGFRKLARTRQFSWTASIERVTQKSLITALTGAAVLLPVAVTLCAATGSLFAALQDRAAARALFAGAFVCGLLWAMSLVGLVLILGFEAASRSDPGQTPDGDELEDLHP